MKRIGDLGTVVTGATPPGGDAERFVGKWPFITPTDLVEGTRTPVVTRFISDGAADSLSRRILPPDSVCFTCIGATIGKACLTQEPAITNQQINSIIVDRSQHDPAFVYYRLIEDRDQIKATAGGAATPIISKSAFENIVVMMPPLPIQRKIAAVLSACDDLIENNSRRINLLEEMAQRIYREWFVEYRFPGHEGVPLVVSELGPIPRGWGTGILGEVLSLMEAGSRPKGGIDPLERGVPSVGAENVIGLGQYDFDKEKFVSREFFERMTRGRLASGDVVLYKDGAYIGRVSLFRDGFPHIECGVNEHVFILRTNERLSQSFLYFWLAEPRNQDRVRALNANAAQPGLNQEKLRALALTIPPVALIRRFTETIEPFVALVFRLALGITRTRAARNLLLPRLISGQIDVSDLDIAATRFDA